NNVEKENNSGSLSEPLKYNVADPMQGAVKINWNQLTDVSFKTIFNKEYQMDIMYPVFGAEVKKIQSKQLSISGYMIPLDIKAGLYAISRFTYSSCFFCGAAGVESVVSLKFKNKP